MMMWSLCWSSLLLVASLLPHLSTGFSSVAVSHVSERTCKPVAKQRTSVSLFEGSDNEPSIGEDYQKWYQPSTGELYRKLYQQSTWPGLLKRRETPKSVFPLFGDEEKKSTSRATSKPSTSAGRTDSSTFAPDSLIHEALRMRLRDIERGLGKRYKVKTRSKGFLPVHSEPRKNHENPWWSTGNVVGKLYEGQIVMSIGEPVGDWIHHDGGGWSMAKIEGFTSLHPLDE